MSDSAQSLSWRLAAAEAARSQWHDDDALPWLAGSRPAVSTPVAAQVWVFTPDLSQVLLVERRWRSWVPPGGTVRLPD